MQTFLIICSFFRIVTFFKFLEKRGLSNFLARISMYFYIRLLYFCQFIYIGLLYEILIVFLHMFLYIVSTVLLCLNRHCHRIRLVNLIGQLSRVKAMIRLSFDDLIACVTFLTLIEILHIKCLRFLFFLVLHFI